MPQCLTHETPVSSSAGGELGNRHSLSGVSAIRQSSRSWLRPVLPYILIPPFQGVLALLLGFTYLGIANGLVCPLRNEVGGRTIGVRAILELPAVLEQPLNQRVLSAELRDLR